MPNWLPDLSSVPPFALVGLVFVLCICDASVFLGSFVAGEIVLVPAAILAAHFGVWEVLGVFAAGAAGSITGQSGSYLVGWFFGPKLRHSRLGTRMGEPRWERVGKLVNEASYGAAITIRFMSVGHTLGPVLAGTTRMPYLRALRLCVAGSVPWAAVWTGVGLTSALIGRSVDSGVVSWIITGVAALVVGVAVTTAVRRQDRGADDRRSVAH
ncbi:hypothetical protein D5S17_11260 [Pseudonocardiaceae bacterium YIM PH 21723]|nr:hypothetical protein D5S17_11260 [Pseudonocardiaceae bacterium YIM PH 21723]